MANCANNCYSCTEVMRLLGFVIFLLVSLSSAKSQPSRARFALTVGSCERAELQLRAGSDSAIANNINKIPATVEHGTSCPLEGMAKRLAVGTLFLAWYMLKYVAHFYTIIKFTVDSLKPDSHFPFFHCQRELQHPE